MRSGIALPFVRRRDLAKQKARGDQYKEWFQSAMVMVDHVPIGVIWSDPDKGFEVTYANAFGRRMLEAQGAEKIQGCALPEGLPALAERRAELADPARLPIALRCGFGALMLELQVVGISNAEGRYIGAMAVWTDVTKQDALTRDFEGSVKQSADQVSRMAMTLQDTAESMDGIARKARVCLGEVSGAAGETNANVQTVAAAAEQLAASVGEVGQRMEQSMRATRQATDAARQTQAIVGRLSDGAQRIGDVIALISGIAAQTNLLALNATIEAARAGEAGRGFGVVAGEVKSLAAQTARATGDIANHVGEIQAATAEAVTAIGRIAATIEEAGSTASSIAAAVVQQGSATAEIARSTQQVAAGTERMTRCVAELGQETGRVDGSAAQVLDLSSGLSREADTLQTGLRDFLGRLAARAG